MTGIICFWDRYATPYLVKYERVLQNMGISFEVIFWNRNAESNDETITQKGNEINVNIPCFGSKSQKIKAFLCWKHTATKIIKKRKYAHLIVLSTVPAVLLYRTLMQDYKENYIFDIRDYTFEANKIFQHVIMNLVNHSALAPISSRGFMRWLCPSNKIIVNHNITVNQEMNTNAPKFEHSKKINFAFVGNVRLDTQTKALLLALKDIDQIEQHYYGRIIPSCDIEEIKEKNSITNLYLHGPFSVNDKREIFKEVDLINCVYANAQNEEDIPLGDSTPLPNRLYDALVFYRPIVSSKGTFLAELVEQYHLGCCVNGFDVCAKDDILEYVETFDEEKFVNGCNELKSIVITEEHEFLQRLKSVLCKW